MAVAGIRNARDPKTHMIDGAEDLVGEGLDSEWVRVDRVERVDGAIAEGEEGGERSVDDIGGDEIEKDAPAMRRTRGRPGANEAPPEEQRGAEETDVFEVVPVLMLEGEVISNGDMPAEECDIHRKPREARANELVTEPAQRLESKQWAGDADARGARQTTQQRYYGQSEKNERGARSTSG